MPFLSDILVELDDAVFDPATDILELIDPSGVQGGSGDSFSVENDEASLIYVFDWKKRRSFIRFMLGFSYADADSPYLLRRENPQAHPTFPTLTAVTIHFQGVGLTTDEVLSDPIDTPTYPAVFTTDALKKTTYFDKVWATVRFTQQPWQFLEDSEATDFKSELDRNTFFSPQPQVDLLQAEGGTSQLKFNEGNPAASLAKNTVIGSAFATQVTKVTYVMNWMWVPEDYLSSDNFLFFPKNLFGRPTMVNSVPFLNRSAGTMMMLAPQMKRFLFPISTMDGFFPFAGWNITIPFVYFDPVKGIPENDPSYAALTTDQIPRGHRLAPWRVDGKWYDAVRDDGVTHLLLEADLYDAFRHILDPGGPPEP